MYPLDYNAYTTGLSSCRFQPNRHQGLTMAHAGPSEAAMQSQERYGHMQSNPDESSPSRYHSPAFVDDFTTTSVGLTNVVMRTTPSQSPAPSDDYSDTIYHKQAYVGGKQEYQPWAPVEWAPSGPPVPIGGEYGYMASAPRDYRTVASFIEGGGSSGQPMSYNPDAMPSGSHFQPPPMPQYSSRDSNPQPRHSTDDPPLAPLPQYSYPRSVDPRLSGLADMPRTSQRLAAETSMVSINSPSMISDGSRPPIRAPIAVPGSFPSYGYATRQSSRTEDPPVEDLSPKFRSTATAVQSSLSVTVFGVGVGNCGVAVRGERVSFDVTARTGSSELWQFQVTNCLFVIDMLTFLLF